MKIYISLWVLCLTLALQLNARQIERFPGQKYALVTGASRGIGKALVEVLLERDKDFLIFAVARDARFLDDLKLLYPNHVIPIVADLCEDQGLEEIQKTVRSTLGEEGRLSYVVHNAAILSPLGDLDYLQEQSLSELYSMVDQSYRTNVIAPHLLTIALLPELRRAGDGKVLFVSSRAGEIALPGMVTYSCTKAALDHLAKNLQASLQKEVAIGALHPGEVDTDMQLELRSIPEEQLALSSQFKKAEKTGRLISATTSAKFIAYLLCDTSFEEFSEKKWDIYFVRPSQFPEELSDEIGLPPGYLKPLPEKKL